MTSTRVLVVDDDPQIRRAVATSLRARSYEVSSAPTGEMALELLSETAVDLLILDLALPGIGGRDVIERLRSWSDVPVIVLSVHESQEDKVAALDAGADDYVTKPFAMGELLARMRAVTRRSIGESASAVLSFDELELHLPRQLVRKAGEDVRLTPTEYRLLEALATNPGKLLTHGWLLQKVWGPGYHDESHYLRVFVRQLRRKIGDDPGSPGFIATEPGLGYRWKLEPSGR